MGKGTHINPILSSTKKSSSSLPSAPRKVNKNKKHDIRIPVSEELESVLRREAIKYTEGSKTKISTQLFLFGLKYLHHYPAIKYEDGPIIVHVKVEQEVYEELGEYAAEWRLSMRQAAHRIFMEALNKKQLKGISK